ncbi:type IV pilin [Halorussus limi]|uniref:Type IV pilin n=1 Tax=Halorussus limi TaxID=2938695 RepID=A0A8U0HSV6_9EURY|nr:type IV pilin [Halorussus limi]UPV73776.1 type IV pilin [Halorussus limi]
MRFGTRSISPVVGVALLVVVVVALAVVFFAAVGGVRPSGVAPQAATTVGFEATVDQQTGATNQYMILRHGGGETIDPQNLKVVVRAGDRRVVNPEIETGGALSGGDATRFNLTGADLCSSSADEATVDVYHEPTGKPVAEQTIRIERNASFEVVDNAVKSDVPYEATVTIPGSGYATLENHDGTDYYLYWPVESRIVVSGPNTARTLTPFPDGDPNDALTDTTDDDINNPVYSFPMTYETDRIPAEANVTVEMKSYVFGGDDSEIIGEGSTRSYAGTQYEEAHVPLDDYERTIDSSDPSEDNVEILRDGDSVPTWGESSPHQDDLQDLLRNRIDGSGNLNLSDNEFVAVFELNESLASGDFNDVVAVIELDPRPTYEETEEGHTLRCGN